MKENFRGFSEVLVDSSESTILNITSLRLFEISADLFTKKENFRGFSEGARQNFFAPPNMDPHRI